MLREKFINKGFRFIESDYYLTNENIYSLHDLKKIFDLELEKDGLDFRKRAYLKLTWHRKKSVLEISPNQDYFQTRSSNKVDGGKLRKFKVIRHEVLDIPIIKSIIDKNLRLVDEFPLLLNENTLTIGMHFIRYVVNENNASYSSPDWLHKDDEPLVFIHLVNLTKSALGGDNLIANLHNKEVTNVLRLENDIDTLVLNKNVLHAVTPLGSRKGIAFRDVILFTVEPSYTQ